MKTIVDVFEHKIDNFKLFGIDSSSLLSIYGNLFFTLDKNDLNNSLLYLKEQYENDETPTKDMWYHDFHKSIRQCDFFTNLKGYREVNKLTDEQNILRESLLKQSHLTYERWKKINPKEEYDEYRKWSDTDSERVEIMKQLRPLNSLANTKEEFSLNGKFDSILWNMIHLDQHGVLKMILEQTFNEYDIYTTNIEKTEGIVQ
jgi:hypothetical protein